MTTLTEPYVRHREPRCLVCLSLLSSAVPGLVQLAPRQGDSELAGHERAPVDLARDLPDVPPQFLLAVGGLCRLAKSAGSVNIRSAQEFVAALPGCLCSDCKTRFRTANTQLQQAERLLVEALDLDPENEQARINLDNLRGKPAT